MIAKMIKRAAEQVQEARAAALIPRTTPSERRQRRTEQDLQARRYVSGPSILAFALAVLAGTGATVQAQSPWPILAGIVVGVYLMFALKVANQWERAVVL